MAAAICYTFHLDPWKVLNATREEWVVRQAAYEIVQTELRRAREQADGKKK